MEAMRKTWTDERLDDMNRRMGDGFRRVDEDIRGLRGEMNARFERLEGKFDALQRILLQTNAVLVAAMIGLIATQL
jgi:hypothetical protein